MNDFFLPPQFTFSLLHLVVELASLVNVRNLYLKICEKKIENRPFRTTVLIKASPRRLRGLSILSFREALIKISNP